MPIGRSGKKVEGTRREVLGGVAATLGAAALGGAVIGDSRAGFAQQAPPGAGGEARTLAAIAQKAGIVFGAAASNDTLADAAYGRLYRDHTRLLTTDNALKFGALRPSEDRFAFEEADALLDFADRHRLMKRGHTLIWNENVPAWLKAKSASDKRRVLDEHIELVCTRYAGRMTIWDVVNEPFWPGHGVKGGYRQGPWLEAFGPAYIERSLRRAAESDPKARLAINEAHCERGDLIGDANRRGMIRLIDDLQHAGVPLHAIGLQGHLVPQDPYNDEAFVAFLHAIAERKLDIHITEHDVDDTPYPDAIPERDAAVAARSKAFLTKVLAVPAVTIVSTWELSDRYSWFRDPDLMRRKGSARLARPLPFDDAMTRKPMFRALAEAFAGRKAG